MPDYSHQGTTTVVSTISDCRMVGWISNEGFLLVDVDERHRSLTLEFPSSSAAIRLAVLLIRLSIKRVSHDPQKPWSQRERPEICSPKVRDDHSSRLLPFMRAIRALGSKADHLCDNTRFRTSKG